MKKVVTGVALAASLFMLAGCGQTSNDKAEQRKESIASSKKRASSSMVKESRKEAKDKVDDAEWAVNGLFEPNEDSTKQEYNYDKLLDDSIAVEDVKSVEDQVDQLPQSADRKRLQKLVAKAMALAKKQTPEEDLAQSEADESSLAKYRSASIDKEQSSISNSVSKDNESSDSEKGSTAKTATGTRYKKVGLETFATNPEKYIGKNIETSGEVTYIQKNPDNEDIYYVVILPKDDETSSGYSFGTVTEINVDTMDETPIQEGDNITVKGGALTSTLKLNGKTLKSDIVVDSLSKN